MPAPPPPADEPADALLQRLEWTVLRRLDGLLQGDHRTLWRGSGLDLADLREYQPGDDARHIDWHATARLQQPQVRQYTEDREMTAWFLVDMSPSMAFGSARHSKLSAARAMLGAVARLLTRHGNAVGALLYRPAGPGANSAQPGAAAAGAIAPASAAAAAAAGGKRSGACQVLPARTGRPQVLQLLRALQAGTGPAAPAAPGRPAATGRRRGWPWWPGRGAGSVAGAAAAHPGDATRLDLLLHQAEGLLRRRAQVLVVSDFISQPGWQAPLARLARRHDVLAVRLVDPAERQLPALGLVTVQDAETGEQVLVDCSDPGFRLRFAQAVAAQDEALDRAFAEAGVDQFELATDEPLLPALMRCTALRRQRLGQPLPRLLPADGRPQAAAVPSAVNSAANSAATAAAAPAFAPPPAA